MRRTITITTAAAALLAAGLTAAAPAMAAGRGPGGSGSCTGSGPTTSTSTQWGQGMGRGSGAAQRGASVSVGTLTADQRADLAYLAEEEKLAHDVYTVLATRYPAATVFARIAESEQQHWDTLVSLLDRYDVADPTAGKAVGQFESADIATLYRQLLDSATTVTAAYQVGIAVEQDDLAEIDRMDDSITAPDASRVLDNLAAGSERHLAAFERLA